MAKCQLFDNVSYCRGQIFKIKQGFGFIKHGQSRDENIFFNLRALVTPPNIRFYNINKYLQIGEIVECIYGESKGEFAGRYSAIRVWKLNASLKLNDRIHQLQTRVLCGTAKVIFRIREIGILDVRDEETYAKDNGQDTTEFVYFNMKEIAFPVEDANQLGCNCFIHFVAVRAAEGSETDYSWNAIRIWKTTPKVKEIEHNPNNLFYAKVEVETVNSVGVVLIHKGNKIALVWTELMFSDTAMEFYEVEKGDLVWCLVGKAPNTGSEPEEEQWIVRKILDTFTHEIEDDHPLPNFYRNNYSALPTQSNNETLELEFLKEFRLNNQETANGDCSQQKGRKKLQQQEADLGKCYRYNPQAGALDLITTVTNSNSPERNDSGINNGCDCCCSFQDDDSPRSKECLMLNCDGTVLSITPYGGKLELSEDPSAEVQFGAHSFYCDGVPIAHTSFQVGTKVHFNARQEENHFQAVTVWIGSAPNDINK